MASDEKTPVTDNSATTGAPSGGVDAMPRGVPWQTKVAVASVAGVVIAGGILVLALACSSQRPAAPKPQAHHKANPADFGGLHNQTLGAPDAKVDVLLVVPLNIDCHAPTIEYLKKIAGVCGAQVRVKFLELRSPEAKELFKKASKDVCATVFINGKYQATNLAGNAIAFTGPLGDRYVLDDLRAAITTEMKKAYGDAALALPDAPAVEMKQPGQARQP